MLRNVGSTWMLTLVTIAATYVLTPFVIRNLGQDGYGTWTLITAMTGYMSLLALGVPMATVRYLAQHVAEGDPQQINKTVGSCAGLYLMIGAGAVVIGAAASLLFLAVYDIPPALQIQARVAFALMALHVSVGFIALLPEGILMAHHDFVLRNVIRVGGVLLRLGLTIVLLRLETSLIVLALIQTAVLGCDFGASWFLIRRRYPGIRMSLSDFDWAVVRRIFSFSLYVLLLSAGARLTFETDALVIGAFLGVSAIPFYAVANSLFLYLMEFVVAIAAVVAPVATTLNTQGRAGELREIFLKWSKVALSLTIVIGLFLSVLGPRFIGWWIDPSFEHPAGAVLQILMLSSFVFLPVRGVALPILMGLGKPKVPTIAYVAAGLLNLGLSIALVGPMGLAGVALGTAIPNVLFAVVVLALTCREVGIGIGTYVRYVVPRAALGALPVLALLLWFRVGARVNGIFGLAAAGTAMVLLFGLTWIFFVYRDDPYVNVRGPLTRFRAWSRA
jgi:O-antigen/teichoic acid export membrane protein